MLSTSPIEEQDHKNQLERERRKNCGKRLTPTKTRLLSLRFFRPFVSPENETTQLQANFQNTHFHQKRNYTLHVNFKKKVSDFLGLL